MDFEVRPLASALGAEVIGLDMSRPIDEETQARLRQAWLQNLVLLFRGQKLSPPDLIAFSKRFATPRPGDVLVVDRSGEDRHACFGAVMSAAVQAAGAAGVVIDGRACDFADIRAQGMPLWCAGPSPILSRRLELGGAVNVPVSCGGVTVNPGDAVLADDTGILVLPPAEVEAVAAEGLQRQVREAEVLARMAAGEKLSDIAGFPRLADYLER